MLLVTLGGFLAERDGGPGLLGMDPRSFLATATALAVLAGLPGLRWAKVLGRPRALIVAGVALYATGTAVGLLAGTARTSLFVPGVGEIVVAEMARALLVVGIAVEVSDRRAAWRALGRGAPAASLAGPVLGAVVVGALTATLTGDLGGALLLGASVALVVSATSGRLWPVVLGALSGAGAGSVVLGISARAAARWALWLHPASAPQPTQLAIGLFALTDGGLFGQGLGYGQPQVIPLHDSDFALVAVGNELGAVGLFAVVALLAVIVTGLLQIAAATRDGGEGAAVGAAATLIACEGAVHLFGTTGLVPLTGVPFPFLARGGASLVVLAWLVGMSTHTSVFDRPPAKASSTLAFRAQARPALSVSLAIPGGAP